GLFGGPKAPVGQYGFNVLTGLSRDGDFKIMNSRRAVHRERSGKAAPHQVGQHGGEAAFDDMAANSPDDRFPRRARPVESLNREAERIAGEDFRERAQPPCYA